MDNIFKKYEQIVFYDLEMMGEKENDIIAIGAVKCNSEFKKIDTFHSFIKPIGERQISDFCSELTGIKQIDIDNADDYFNVMKFFFDWCYNDKTLFISWGKQDYTQIFIDKKKNEEYLNKKVDIFNKIKNNYLDFQKVFYHEILPKPASLEKSLKFYSINFLGDVHNPKYDALNLYILFLFYRNSFYKTKSLEIKKAIYKHNDNIKCCYENLANDIYSINIKFKDENEELKYLTEKYFESILKFKVIAAREFIIELNLSYESHEKDICNKHLNDFIYNLKDIRRKYEVFIRLYRGESKECSIIYNISVVYELKRLDKLIYILYASRESCQDDINEFVSEYINELSNEIEKKISQERLI